MLGLVVQFGCAQDVEGQGGGIFGAASGTPTPQGDDGGDGDGGSGSSGGEQTGDGSGDSADGQPATPLCGNGVREDDEACDGEDLGEQSCGDAGFDAGAIVCAADCTVVTDGCFTCGDDTRQLAEVCDGNDLGGESCTTQGFGSGMLACASDCQGLDTSACVAAASCGNGVAEGTEACDGADFAGRTCETEGFDLGTLACTSSCTLDTSACENDLTNCGEYGAFCVPDDTNPQSTCCPAGVGTNPNILGTCNLFICL